MPETPKTKQKKSLAFRNCKNAKNMLNLTKRIKETKTNQNDQMRQIKSVEKISKTRSKQILQNFYAKPKSEESRTVRKESKVIVIRGKGAKKTKANKCMRSNKTQRKPESTFFLSQLRKSFNNQIVDKQSFSKENLQTKSPEENPAGSASKMIFVSLDFIEDCQAYKKKFMKPMCGQELKSLRKSLRNISSYHKRYLNSTEQIQTSQRDNNTHKQIQRGSKNPSQRRIIQNCSSNAPEEKTPECFAAEDSTNSDQVGADAKIISNELPVSDELPSLWEKLSTETYSVKQSSNVKPSSEDVSTVDKKYIELLLSIANCNETKQKLQMKNDESKYGERDGSLVQFKKKKISGKTYFENKIKKEKLEREKRLEQNERELSERLKKSTELNIASTVSQEDTVFARLVRDMTKSEVQIMPRKRKNPQSSRNSETPRAKQTAHSKPEVNDNRKKRRTRNKILKNNNEDIVEVSFPCEISKVADVKELWRRGSRNKSENSLSSRSSSTTHENDELLECKNAGLESYKILRKIVEEEVKTICKNFVEDQIEDIHLCEKENNQEDNDKESSNMKNMCKELRTIVSENANDIFNTNGNKADEVINRKIIQDEEQKFNPNCEGKKERDDFLKYLDKHETKDLDPKLLKTRKNHPSELVKNWSILHRLEQAFLALGTPTFPNHKIKDSKALKITGMKTSKKSSENVKYPEGTAQKSKIHQKNKDNLDKQRTLNATSSKRQRDASENRKSKLPEMRNAFQSSRNVKTENNTKQPVQKEKNERPNNTEIPRSQQQRSVALNSPKISEGEEKSMQKKGKFQNQKPNVFESKKSPPRSLAKPKVCEFESRFSKRDVRQKKYKHNVPSKNPSPAKDKSDTKGGLAKKLVSNPDENLERKKTFDVIPLSASKIKARKSKSYNKIEDSPELDNTKKRFPPTRSGDAKNLNFLDFSNGHDENISQQIKTDVGTMKPDLTQKTPAKSKPSQPQDRPKTACEKECSKGSRETLPKTAMDRTCQEERIENIMPEVDSSGEMLTSKELDKSNDRAVKERSILSIRGNQHADHIRRKQLLHFQGKSGSNLAHEGSPSSSLVEKPLEEGTLKDTEPLPDIDAQVSTPDTISFQPGASTCTFDVTDKTLREEPSEECPQEEPSEECPQEEPSEECPQEETSEECPQEETSEECPQEEPSEECPQEEKTILNEDETLEELSSLSNLSIYAFEQQQNVENAEIKCLKRQQIWEQDIKQYRAIVKEIMSQYKRIDGFLKQNEQCQNFPNDSVSLMAKEEVTCDDISDLPKNPQGVNIYEYRKKILSEYQALPIFEYKTKIQQEAGNNKLEEKRRNLAFVKALKTEMDLDVKDYQPNIQKILDSQLYVDTENVLKRKEPCVKFSEKKSSLQEIVTSKNEKTVKEEECLRSISTPKTFLSLSRDPVHSRSVQNYAKINSNSNISLKTQLLKI